MSPRAALEAVIGLFSFIGGLFGGGSQKKAADKAAKLQYDAAMAGIAASERQFDQTRTDYAPFREAGYGALDRMSDLIGLGGEEAQQIELDLLRKSPLFKTLYSAGEDAILANASATGGLRGGDTQRSLYDLGEDTFSALIRQQLADYGGIVGIGTGATDAVSSFGARAIAEQNDLRNYGAGARAQAALVRGGVDAGNWKNAGSFLDSTISSFIPGGSAFSKLF